MSTRDPVPRELRDLRDSIDNIDAAMVYLLAERFRCTYKVGKLKARQGLLAGDPEREAEQLARLRHLAALSRLDPNFAEKFFRFVVREVVSHHESFRVSFREPLGSSEDVTQEAQSPTSPP
jgi:chorismate mutase